MNRISLATNISAIELAELAKSKDLNLCKQVAQHPNTSPETLKELFKRVPGEVLSNPILDLLLLENPNFFEELLRTDITCFVKSRLPLHYQEWAAFHQRENYRLAIACSKNISSNLLTKLVNDSSDYVRQAVASNPNISEITARQILEDNNPRVLISLAHNANLTSSILEQLATHPNILVRASLAGNCHIASSILKKLSLTNEREILKALALNLNTPITILEKLSSHENIELRCLVARNKNISEVIMINLAQEAEDKVINALSSNENLTPKLLDRISQLVFSELLRDKESLINTFFNIALHPKINSDYRNRFYNFFLEKYPDLEALPLEDYCRIKHHSDLELQRLKWTENREKEHLQKTYSKESRSQLNDKEFIAFLQYLQNL